MRKIDPILNRIKQVLRVNTDREMTEKWGIKYSTLDTWKSRDKIPSKRLKEFAQNESISLDWVLYGDKNSHIEENSIKNGEKMRVIGDGNTTLNGNININTQQFNHADDIEEIINLLQYAPSEFLSIVKDKLKKYKEITHL